MLIPIFLSRLVLWIAVPSGTSAAIKKITDQLIDSYASWIDIVFNTINRIVKSRGIFAAIIDGDINSAPEYLDIYNIIYKYVQLEYPNYGSIELGDLRVRNSIELYEVAFKSFSNAEININNHLLYFSDCPKTLAIEVAGFFYASFVLSIKGHKNMIMELENYFLSRIDKGISRFTMPVNLLSVNFK